MDIDDIMLDSEDRMEKSVQAFREQLIRVRSGKASVGLLDGIKVNLYGTEMGLKQCANLLTPEARLIVIQPYDKNAIPAIEKAILTANLGLNPVNDGMVVRVSIPVLTEERRRELVKLVHKYAEESRTAIRQIRRQANEQVKQNQKDGQIPEDEMYRVLEEIQEMTDDHVKKIDEIMEEKEREIMEI